MQTYLDMICTCLDYKIVSYHGDPGLQNEIIKLHDNYLMNEPRSEQIRKEYIDELFEIELYNQRIHYVILF